MNFHAEASVLPTPRTLAPYLMYLVDRTDFSAEQASFPCSPSAVTGLTIKLLGSQHFPWIVEYQFSAVLESNLGKRDVKMGMRWLRRSQNLEGLVEEEDEVPWSPTVSPPRAWGLVGGRLIGAMSVGLSREEALPGVQ